MSGKSPKVAKIVGPYQYDGILRWPTSATAKKKSSRQKRKAHDKREKLTAKKKSPRQKRKAHRKKENLMAKKKSSRQKRKAHGKKEKLTAKKKSSRQKGKPHGKKLKSSRRKLKLMAGSLAVTCLGRVACRVLIIQRDIHYCSSSV